MPIPLENLLSVLQGAFPGAAIDIQDLAGDMDHYHITICSKQFVGKTRVQQHQMVYKALQGIAGTTLHALGLTTQIPN